MATLKYLLDVTAPDAKKTFDAIGVRMADLDKNLQKTRDLSIGDKQAMATFAQVQLRADRFRDRISNMPLTLEGAAKAEAQLLGLEATADKLDKKLGGGGGGFLARLLPGGAGGASGGATGLAAVLPGATGAVNPYTIAAALAALPFAAQAAAGGIVTALGGALAGIAILGASKTRAVKDSFADLSKTANADLVTIGKPFVPVLQSIASTAGSVLGKLTGPLTTAVKTIAGPFKTFADALVRAFGQKSVQTAIQAVATAFGAILKALTPTLAGDVSSIAGGITNIAGAVSKNPKAFADFISFLFRLGGFALDAIAALTNVATYIEKHFLPALHDIANVFDGVRHEVAHIWDLIYSNTIGTVIRLVTDVHKWVANMRHDTANVFDGIRHDIASIWDTVWNNTVGRAIRGVQDVQNVIKKIPGWLEGFFKGAINWLVQGGKNIVTGLLNGIKNAWNAVISWLKGLPHMILKVLGIASPPAWAIDAGQHIMGGILKGFKLGVGDVLSFVAGVGGKIGNLASGFLFNTVEPPGALARFGNAGTGPASIVELAQKMAAARGWSSQWGDINAIEMAEAGWQLGARNPSSGAYGIAQFINGPSEYAEYGGNATTAVGQITAFYNYIAQRYGNPAAAWAHESRYHWYDKGGWLMPGTTVAVNNTGRPERILPPGQGQDRKIVVEFKTAPGASRIEQDLVDIMVKYARTAGGGDVQVAFGS